MGRTFSFAISLATILTGVCTVASSANALESVPFTNQKVASVFSVVQKSINSREAKIENLTASEKARIALAESLVIRAFTDLDSSFAGTPVVRAAKIRQLSRSYSSLSKLLSGLAVSKKSSSAIGASPVTSSTADFQAKQPSEDFGTKADITYYADTFEGRGTAAGERFSQSGFSAARCSIPFGTLLQVSFGGKSVIVKANDRPNCSKYPDVVDLSKTAFETLAPASKGRLSGFVAELSKVSSEYRKKTYSPDSYDTLWISLDAGIPNTYLPGETLRISGKVTDGKTDSVFFLKTPSGESISLSYSVEQDGRFAYLYPLLEEGEYEFVVASGMGFSTDRVETLTVLSESVLEQKRFFQAESFPTKLDSLAFERRESSDLSAVNVLIFPEDTPRFLKTARISQTGVEPLVRRSMGDIAFSPNDARRFDASKPVHVEIFAAKASTSFSMDTFSRETLVYKGDLPLVASYITERKEAIFVGVNDSTLKVQVRPNTSKTPIRDDIYLILPSWEVRAEKFPASMVDSQGHLLSSKTASAEISLSEKGQYLVEIMYSTGFPAFNGPMVHASPVLPLLPNEYDSASKDTSSDFSSTNTDTVRFINALRKKVGKTAISIDGNLTRLAQFKARDMAENQYVGHNDSKGGKILATAERAGIPISGSVGENVAWGSVGIDFLLAGLALSGGHRLNMLGDWGKIGVGAVEKNGIIYYVQVFGE